jgi:hypothetical protein
MPRLSKIGAAALAAFGWTGLQSVTASYLVVAGGGGGGTNISAGDGGCGGGGAGGYRTGTEALNPTQSYSVIVGAGGASGAPNAAGSNGSSSVFLTTTSAGGGGGGDSQNGVKRAGDGGSGGGAGYINSAAGSGNTPSTSPSQGSNGGSYSSGDHGAGGGGATAAGSNTAGSPGAGGAGTPNSISGSAVTYAGGGGGGGYNTTGALGGSGGGGQGGSNGAAGISGTANLGGGGGGGGGGSAPPTVGGAGGSGVVIISYVGAQQFGGGIVTSSGGNTIHTFTTSGTLSPLSSLTANFLVVAGGGGGGGGNGGGGAGGLLSGSGLTLDTNSIYAVTVGAGGTAAGASAGGNGGNSSFSMVSTTAVGGGGGGYQGGTTTGASGGSGGGGSYLGSAAGGTGTAGQGNNGGSGIFAAVQYGGGGGGGANAVGANGTSTAGGNGGSGLQNPITGSTTGELSGGIYYLAGGGGGGANTASAGTGGLGGGGAGGINSGVGTAGTPNTGGGGGGGATTGAATFSGGAGGSGIVIISYPGSTQQMAGGTVTVAGGNVIHTFTSSGYLTPIVLVNNSLRFRESASSYLNRTPTTAGNNQNFTMSVWYKPGNIGTSFTNANFISAGGDGSNIIIAGSGAFGSTVDNRFLVRENNATAQFYWPMVFRDPAAWYHIVLAVDTTQTNSNNRAKLYVNGVDQGAFSGTGYSLSATTSFNTVTAHYIGAFNSAYYYTSCYFAEYNWIDGQQLTPNSFGTFNGLGVWQPIRYGGSYGTNGFYLPFTASQSYTGSFNGTSQYLSVAANAAFNFSGNFTAECFFNTATVTNVSQPALFTIGDDSNGLVVTFFSGNFYAYMFGVGGYFTSVTPPLNQWVHVAWVRVGSTNTLYINGVARATATISGTLSSTGGVTVGRSGSSGSSFGYFQGSVSNFRLNNTALYTANFTPSTSPLTAVSGTQLLTLQNATFVDNSTNAFTVTNNGSTPTAITYPFAYTGNTVKDFGPVGNNWTTNNIGTLSGSTLDTMTDVPTLTSATTANYCVLNPLVPVYANSISYANMRFSNSQAATWATANSTLGVSSGKWYWEATITTLGGAAIIGISNSDTIHGSTALGQLSNDYAYLWNGNKQGNAGSATAYGATYTTGDVIGVALDMDAGTLVFYKNNSSQGTAFTGLSNPSFVPAVSNFNSGVIDINFGQRPFTYTPPTGFVALNTYNLPAPPSGIGTTASTTANKYFDATLYTGNSSTQTVTNSGSMQPDFIWVKSRTYGSSHGLVDSVRGLASGLNSNATSLQTTLTDSITSINSNGFSLGADSTTWFNYGGSYVAWQWRASNATAVTNTAGSIISSVSANTTAGFSIVTYTGNGTAGVTVGHGLGIAPDFIILKNRASSNWWVYPRAMQATYSGEWLYLNFNFAHQGTGSANDAPFYKTNPTDTVFYVAGDGANTSSDNYVAYCFAPVAGYSAFGTYTGNNDDNGPFIYTGFRPRWVMVKNTTSAQSWQLMDTSRSTYNVATANLLPNSPTQELTGTDFIDILSNGFKIRRNSAGNWNNSGDTYLYVCFAENPFKYANAR